MKKATLSVPQLFFVIGTRAALGAGVGLLLSGKLSRKTRKRTGIALAVIGAATTIPAARFVMKSLGEVGDGADLAPAPEPAL